MSFPSSNVRALLVEDDEVDAERVQRCLRGAPELVGDLQEARRLKDALTALEADSFELVLLDLSLPDSRGLTTATRVLAAAPYSAVVILSGQSDQQTALKAMTLGASDFLVKGEFDERLLVRSLTYALERQRILLRLQKSEADYRLLAEHSADLITRHAADGTIKFASEASRVVLGREPDELLGLTLETVADEEHKSTVSQKLDSLSEVGITRFEFRARCAQGKLAWMETIARRVNKGSDDLVLVTRNVQDRKAAEDRLREREGQLMRARQLESLGRLAGGVAHDFNNLLTIIGGYAGLVLEDLSPEHSLRAEVQEICDASQRGARLVGQLLAVARQQVSRPRQLDLHQVLEHTARLLRTALGEQIELRVKLDPETPRVWMDPTQLEQVLLNLAFNARDAMPSGGLLELGAGPSPTGRVLLTIRDTGCGMEKEVLEHVFEPFFTTKGELGTGLGLATVYGLVKQAEGSIEIDSRPGEGTLFSIELPAASTEQEPSKKPLATASRLRGHETVLVLDDNELVRQLAVKTLERAGFKVLAARSGPEALEMAVGQQLDLLLTDVAMPQMSGIEVVERMRSHRPDLKILLMSGYNQDPEVAAALEQGRLDFLPKPFGPAELVESVRRVLDHP